MITPLRLAAVLCAAGLFASGGAQYARAAGEGTDAGPPGAAAPGAAAPGEPAPGEVTWDRTAGIQGAAERLGRLHRAKGAKAAFELIDNCYRTHILAEHYGEGFEACITQDYLETRTLIQVYSRMPVETLHKLGVPSPEQLAQSMGQRISTAFQHYNKPQSYADELKALVDRYGVPVFLTIVFPEAVRGQEQRKQIEKQQPQ